MSGRGESVPFAFVAEADRFRSNVEPPARQRATGSQIAGRVLLTVTVLAGLAGAIVLGAPALNAQHAEGAGGGPAVARHR
jgi:hypothetical protein